MVRVLSSARIMDMGLTKGTEVYVRKVAPLGDPIEVNVRSYELSLRKADCERDRSDCLVFKSANQTAPAKRRCFQAARVSKN